MKSFQNPVRPIIVLSSLALIIQTLGLDPNASRRSADTASLAASTMTTIAPDEVLPSATGESSFVINGGGFSNQKQKATDTAPMGWYDAQNRIAHVSVGKSTDAVAFTLQFEGNKTGAVEGYAGQVQFFDGKKQTTYYADRGTLQVKVTRYDAVGGLIEGTFSGKYSDMSRKTSVTITNGKFSVSRRKDE